MEIKSLRYFLAIAREENMTKAADILHVTQPTLSKTLKSLEDELGKEIRKLKKRYPGFTYHITSGDTEQVTEKLDKGLLDFAVLCEKPNTAKYDYVKFPEADIWGAVMPADHPLAAKKSVKVKDLIGQPLFCSEQSWNNL